MQNWIWWGEDNLTTELIARREETGEVLIDGTEATITGGSDEKPIGVIMETSQEKVSTFGGLKIGVDVTYKVEETINAQSCGIALFEDERQTWVKEITPPAAVSEWETVHFEKILDDIPPASLYLFAFIQNGTGVLKVKDIRIVMNPTRGQEGEWYGPDRIKSCEFKASTTDGADIEVGGCCSTELKLVVIGKPKMVEGDNLIYYRRDEEKQVLKAQVLIQKPQQTNRNTYTVDANDNLLKTEVDMTEWLGTVQFPISLKDFVQSICDKCGLEWEPQEIPNADYQIQEFSADGVMARDLLVWAGQACGRFIRIRPSGRLEFAWYTDKTETVGIRPYAQKEDLFTYYPFYLDGLKYEDYEVSSIDKVQIRQTESDVGVIYPPDAEGTNTYVIQGNFLLSPLDDESLRPIAQSVYETLKDVQYRPCSVSMPETDAIDAGDIVTVEDINQNQFVTYITSHKLASGKADLTSVGNPQRDSVAAVNSKKYSSTRGKVLDIQASVDGFTITASETDDVKTSRLSLSTRGIELSSADISFKGLVSFTNLSTDGETVISGGNITTGTLDATKVNVTNLNASNIVTGTIKSKDGKNYINLDTGDARFEGVVYARDGTFTGTVNANAGTFNSVTIGNSTITGSSLGGTLNWPDGNISSVGGSFTGNHNGGSLTSTGGSFVGTHSGGSLSSTGGTFVGTNSGSLTGTHRNGIVSSCNLNGTSLSGDSGNTGSFLVGAGTATVGASNSARLQVGNHTIVASGSGNSVNGGLNVNGSLSCTGTKPRTMTTANFGKRQLDAYETPHPTFSDYGTAKLDDDGICYIWIDPIFAETVNPAYTPTVFLTPYGGGQIWVADIKHDVITVNGEPGLLFAWESRYEQWNCDQGRLREYKFEDRICGEKDFDGDAAVNLEHAAPNMELLADEYLNLYAATSTDYGAEGARYYESYERRIEP